jgi:SAM-dependent methyltransferase
MTAIDNDVNAWSESLLVEALPERACRVLDLSAGTGSTLERLREHYPNAELMGVELDDSVHPHRRDAFATDGRVTLVAHDVDVPLPDFGTFDVVVARFAIHQCADARAQALYREIFELLSSGGSFVAVEPIGVGEESTHLEWLRAVGFVDTAWVRHGHDIVVVHAHVR